MNKQMQTRISSKSKEVIIGPDQPVVIIGERINPTGRRKLAASNETGDRQLIQAEALAQVAAGAQVLDVNVGTTGTDEKALVLEALAALAEVTDVPLCIDSAKPEVLAAGLEDIVIDPLAMSVAASDKAGLSALEALQAERSQFGVNQTIGASNVSFGLPDRPFINSVFLSMAVFSGLTCPITDPTVWAIREAMLIGDLMMGKDAYAMNFIGTYREQHPDA